MQLIERLKQEGYVVNRMDREDQRALLVPCACADDPMQSFVPGCHMVTSGVLTLEGPRQWWLVEESDGFRYVDMATGTVIHGIHAAMHRFGDPCDPTKVPLLDEQSALKVAWGLAAHHAVDFKTPKGGSFFRLASCDNCRKLVSKRDYLVKYGEVPVDPGYYLHGREAMRLMRLVYRLGIFCKCPR